MWDVEDSKRAKIELYKILEKIVMNDSDKIEYSTTNKDVLLTYDNNNYNQKIPNFSFKYPSNAKVTEKYYPKLTYDSTKPTTSTNSDRKPYTEIKIIKPDYNIYIRVSDKGEEISESGSSKTEEELSNDYSKITIDGVKATVPLLSKMTGGSYFTGNVVQYPIEGKKIDYFGKTYYSASSNYRTNDYNFLIEINYTGDSFEIDPVNGLRDKRVITDQDKENESEIRNILESIVWVK